GPDIAYHQLVEGTKQEVPRASVFGVTTPEILVPDRSGDRIHLGLGLLQAYGWLQPRDHTEKLIPPPAGLQLVSRRSNLRPKLAEAAGFAAKLKTARRNTNNHVSFAVESKALADNIRISAEPAPPQAVAEHNHFFTADLILLWKNSASIGDVDAK